MKPKRADPSAPPDRKRTNPLLALTIFDTARSFRRGELDAPLAVMHAAVHGWYEGHVEGHAAKGSPSPVKRTADPCPAPPYPGPHDPALKTIIDEAARRFPASAIDGAIAFAAGLGWAAGLKEGGACSGCVTPGQNIPGEPDPTDVRAGEESVTLDDDELKDAIREARPVRRPPRT